MNLIHRITGTLRSGRDGHHDSGPSPAAVHWRQQIALMSVQRDLDETADEQAYIDAEIARSRDYAERLDSAAAAAAAGGCAEVAREIHEELDQTYAFLAELAEVRPAVFVERNRLSELRKHLADRLAEGEAPAEIGIAGAPDDVGILVDRVIAETMRTADEEAHLEAGL